MQGSLPRQAVRSAARLDAFVLAECTAEGRHGRTDDARMDSRVHRWWVGSNRSVYSRAPALIRYTSALGVGSTRAGVGNAISSSRKRMARRRGNVRLLGNSTVASTAWSIHMVFIVAGESHLSKPPYRNADGERVDERPAPCRREREGGLEEHPA